MKDSISDADYFKQFCAGVDIVFNSQNDEVAFVKDHDFIYRGVSEGFISTFYRGEKISANDILGKASGDQPKFIKNPQYLTAIQKEDQLVHDTLKTHRFLFIDNNNTIFIVTKRPVINPATNNFVGIFACMRNFMHPHILNLIYKMNGVKFGMANANQTMPLKFELTERQHMVLFLYVNKYSNTEIASIMGILGQKLSAGRVNDHLENLKYIFAVKSKEQLIEKAISYKYHLFIPRKFLKPGSYLLDDEIIISDE